MLTSGSEVTCEERRAQLASLRATLTAARQRLTHVTTSLGLQPRPRQGCAMVACPVDPEHRVNEENLPRHASACQLRKRGYLADDVPLPGDRGDLGLVITNEDACCIIQKELCKNPRLKTGSRVQFTTTRVVCRPAAVGGLAEGCEPETWQRITVDFTPDERRAIYDHVVAVTAPQRVPPPPELAFSGPLPAPRHGPTGDEVGDSLVAKMAAERDARRRRVSQKKVSTNRKSHLEVLREVIGNQMQLYSEWLGDGSADPTASSDQPDRHRDLANAGVAPSEVRHGQQPGETVGHRANEQVRNREYDRYRDKGRDDRGREYVRARDDEGKRGVRFRDDNTRHRDGDTDWEVKDRCRERDGTRENNQRHRESFGSSEGKERRRESFGSSEAKDRYRERDIGRGDKGRHRIRDGEEYVSRRDDSSRSSVSLRDDRGTYSRRDSGREDKRFRGDKDRSRDRDWERADVRLGEEERYIDKYGGREQEEREDRVLPAFENTANVVVKQEQESDEEVVGTELDYGNSLGVKTERVGDDKVRQGKRKRNKEYDWSEDSEREAKKQKKKKKKKKHKKHKKKKAQSSSESESS